MGPQSGPMAAPRGRPGVNLPSISRVSGLLVGLSLALLALVGARVPAGTGEVPASASLKAEPSVKLGVAPVARELLSERRLVPGGSVSGVVEVSNLTGASLLATPRIHPVRGEAPAGLQVALLSGGRTLYSGSVARFHRPVRLGAREARALRFRLSAPRDRADEIEGRSFELAIKWRTERAGSR
jgi:hypothetical protein